MRQNFRRDKFRKEEMRRKKQEEKRNKRLHKKDAASVDSPETSIHPAQTAEPVPPRAPQVS